MSWSCLSMISMGTTHVIFQNSMQFFAASFVHNDQTRLFCSPQSEASDYYFAIYGTNAIQAYCMWWIAFRLDIELFNLSEDCLCNQLTLGSIDDSCGNLIKVTSCA